MPTKLMLLSITVAVLACSTEEKDSPSTDPDVDADADADADTDADADADTDCDTDLGTFSGVVISALPWDEEEVPQANARLSVRLSDMSEEYMVILTDAEGVFTAPLPEGEYRVQARSEDWCVSEWEDLSMMACETLTKTLRLIDCLDG